MTPTTVRLWLKFSYLWCIDMYAIHQDSSPINMRMFQTQLYVCRSTTSWCDGFLIACMYIPINLAQMLWKHLQNLVSWLWCHWPFMTSSKVVFCLMWDHVISVIWRLSHTTGCARQTGLSLPAASNLTTCLSEKPSTCFISHHADNAKESGTTLQAGSFSRSDD